MNYQEIITTKVLIDEYNIESDAPLVKNALNCNINYKKDDKISEFKNKEHIPFSLEYIIISDVVLIENWTKYNKNINKFINNEIQRKLYNYTRDDEKELYKDTYNTNSSGYVFSGLFYENSKYSKYLSNIMINRSKINDYCYFVTIYLSLNDKTKSVFENVVNNHCSYKTGDWVTWGFSFDFNDNGFYYYADIIKYEITKYLKNDGLISMTDISNTIYTLYTCKTDLAKCYEFSFLRLNSNSIQEKIDDILTSNNEKRALFYLMSDISINEFIRNEKIKFLSLLTCYYNLIYNILLSINYEQLMVINDDLCGSKVNYKKIKSINNRYFLLSRIINNYKTPVFFMYGGLQFYNGERQIKSETCVESAYDSIRKVKNEFDTLYKDVLKIYDINRIHDDSHNSIIMLFCNIITLGVAILSLLFSIHISNKQTTNEESINRITTSNNNVTISSISEASKTISEDIALISQD